MKLLKSAFNRYIDSIWLLNQFAGFIHNPLVFFPTINSVALLLWNWGYRFSPVQYIVFNIACGIIGVIGGKIIIKLGWAARNIELGNRQNQMQREILEIVEEIREKIK